MRKERIKTIALAFLVVMDCVLGSRILIEKKLWPTGYNFFSNIGKFQISSIYTNIKNYFTDSGSLKSQVFYPEKIVINTGDQTTRTSLNSAESEFEGIADRAYELLKSAFMSESESVLQVKNEELYSAMSSDSVYIDFPTEYSPELLSKLLGAQNNVFRDEDISFSDAVISFSPRTEIYLSDRNKYICYKINVTKRDEKLIELLGEYEKKHGGQIDSAINYSFDLKFDKPFGAQKTTLNPLILIYSTPPEFPVIGSVNPIYDGEQLNESVLKNILKVFNINSSTMNRYTEAGGTVVFVENNAILKIDKNGYLDYQATDGGMEISSTGGDYTNILNISSIASQINEAVGNDSNIRISDIDASDNTTYLFDYIVSGIPVKVQTDNISSAVRAVVRDGMLISYKQLIRKYEETGTYEPLPEFFTALDDVISKYSEFMNEINIDKMYFGYKDNGFGESINADWVVKVDNVIADDGANSAK